MTNELHTALAELAKKAEKADKSNEAMQFAQAALSVAHAIAVMQDVQPVKK